MTEWLWQQPKSGPWMMMFFAVLAVREGGEEGAGWKRKVDWGGERKGGDEGGDKHYSETMRGDTHVMSKPSVPPSLLLVPDPRASLLLEDPCWRTVCDHRKQQQLSPSLTSNRSRSNFYFVSVFCGWIGCCCGASLSMKCRDEYNPSLSSPHTYWFGYMIAVRAQTSSLPISYFSTCASKEG